MSPATVLDGPLASLNPQIQTEARAIAQRVADSGSEPLSLTYHGTSIAVPEQLSGLILDLIEKMACGSAVAVVTLPDELTTTTAAEHLGVSRPTLMKMIRDGKLESYKVGTHTRLRRSVVADYAAKRAQERAEALEELQDLDG